MVLEGSISVSVTWSVQQYLKLTGRVFVFCNNTMSLVLQERMEMFVVSFLFSFLGV